LHYYPPWRQDEVEYFFHCHIPEATPLRLVCPVIFSIGHPTVELYKFPSAFHS
jgi:hypothetical protein